MQEPCWGLESAEGKFPTTHRCPPSVWPLQHQGECVGVQVCLVGNEKHPRVGGRERPQLRSSSLSTHRWPGIPCPGWPRGRGSSGWQRRVSWGGRWRRSSPDQSPGSSACSRTSPRCCWASGPVGTESLKARLRQSRHWFIIWGILLWKDKRPYHNDWFFQKGGSKNDKDGLSRIFSLSYFWFDLYQTDPGVECLNIRVLHCSTLQD